MWLFAFLIPCLLVLCIFGGIGYLFRHQEAAQPTLESQPKPVTFVGKGVYRAAPLRENLVTESNPRPVQEYMLNRDSKELMEWIHFISKPIIEKAVRDSLRRRMHVIIRF